MYNFSIFRLIAAFAQFTFFGGPRLYANINLTPDMITDEALRILHQKCNFVGSITRGYDDSFAQEGAKIGNTLRIRHPIQYTTGTGATMSTGTGIDVKQQSVTLTVNSQKHVPMKFTSNELAMDIDEFSKRHIEPAMSVLAAKIEADVLSVSKKVANTVLAGTAVNFADILSGRQFLVNNLAPSVDRVACLDSQGSVDMVTDTKGLFQDSSQIAKQYKEGMMGRHAGFDYYENTLIPSYTSGAAGGTSNYDVVGTDQGLADVTTATDLVQGTLKVDTGTAAIAAGDVFTIGSVNDVHPESKTSTGSLKHFTVIVGGTGACTLTISPPIIYGGAYQNCSAQPANNATVTFLGAASTAYKQSLLFQKGFAVFATADLFLPKDAHFASRRVYDGISMRLWQASDIVKDRLYTRLDVLYGFKVVRPQLAARVLHT